MGDSQSEMLSPTTRSSSTQVTQGAPAPSSLGPSPACTGPRVGQGRSSSLRCGRSTLTNTCGPEHSAKRALTDNRTQVTRLGPSENAGYTGPSAALVADPDEL